MSTRMRSAIPRALSSDAISPAWIVFPRPTSSAISTRQRKSAHDRQGRLELVRQQIDPRAFRRLQAVRRAVRRNQRPAAAPPAARRDQANPPRPDRGLDVVERRDDVCRSSRIRSGCAGQRHDLTGRVRTDGNDPPALAPCEDDIASPEGLLVHHRRRSSRVQKLLRRIGNARQTRTRRRDDDEFARGMPRVVGLRAEGSQSSSRKRFWSCSPVQLGLVGLL